MSMGEEKKGAYLRPTTYPQRKLMIEVYLQTGSVSRAVEAAKVSRSTFYLWYPRYRERKVRKG